MSDGEIELMPGVVVDLGGGWVPAVVGPRFRAVRVEEGISIKSRPLTSDDWLALADGCLRAARLCDEQERAEEDDDA